MCPVWSKSHSHCAPVPCTAGGNVRDLTVPLMNGAPAWRRAVLDEMILIFTAGGRQNLRTGDPKTRITGGIDGSSHVKRISRLMHPIHSG